MAIKIPALQKIADDITTKKFIFKDLHLDIKMQEIFEKTLQKKVQSNDIQVDINERAIKNSLRNLLTTKPGQRFLFPEYGVELEEFLFEAITQENGQLIGEKIVTAIKQYEPRIRVQTCQVVASPDENQYDITIIISMPAFSSTVSINTLLNTKTQSFSFV